MAKTLHFLYPAFIFISICNFPIKSFGKDKVALIVAVGNYPSGSGWETLSSSNDVPVLKNALIKQGFEEKNIAVVQDAQATRLGILKAIQDHLINKVKRGDIAVFHFSGHGQQVWDNNGDETDYYDEALVPYNSSKYYKAGIYEGENLIRDDELGDMLREVRRKLDKKGHLLTLIDACHSGSATRGFSKARGTHVRMASQAYVTAHPGKKRDENFLLDEAPDIEGLAPMVAFFSSGPHQLSYEHVAENGQGYGILSYTFSKTFGSAKKGVTYRSLFDQIRLQISSLSPRQTPQAEGFLDEELLGGNIIGTPQYFLPGVWTDSKLVQLHSGTLAGLHDSTIVAFYPVGTNDTTGIVPLALGTVVNGSLLSCDIDLDRALKGNDRNCRIYIKKQNYGNLTAKLQLEISTASLKEALLSLPKKCTAIQLVKDNPELILQEHVEEGKIFLLSKDGHAIDTFSIRTSGRYNGLIRSIRKAIVNFAQAKFLRPIEMDNPLLNIEAQFRTLEGEVIDLNERKGFRVGEQVKLRILNKGENPFYFSLMDIMPDNTLNVFIPRGNNLAIDYFLQPGAHFEDVINIAPPVGTEVLKLIASEEPLNLQAVVDTRGEEESGTHPIEILIHESYLNDRKRGGETSNVPIGSVSVRSVVFEIY